VSKVLLVHDGKRERELLLVERLIVGRDPACDISVDDGLLSRRHAEFVAVASEVRVRDLGSRNGIFVNGTREVERPLKPGDVVQIGPLRVRYLRDHVAMPGTPLPGDFDGTRMIRATPVPLEAIPPTPRPVSFDVLRTSAAPAADTFDDDEGETRVVSGGAFAETVRGAAAVAVEGTGFTPMPPSSPSSSVAAPAPLEPPVAAEVIPAPTLASFLMVQLGALAVIVFVVTIAPVILSRGTVLSAIDHGSIVALIVWPVLPLVIGLAATLVIANIVNRRVTDVLAAAQQDDESR
jgi:predicted component of type VI protein secretion system